MIDVKKHIYIKNVLEFLIANSEGIKMNIRSIYDLPYYYRENRKKCAIFLGYTKSVSIFKWCFNMNFIHVEVGIIHFLHVDITKINNYLRKDKIDNLLNG